MYKSICSKTEDNYLFKWIDPEHFLMKQKKQEKEESAPAHGLAQKYAWEGGVRVVRRGVWRIGGPFLFNREKSVVVG